MENANSGLIMKDNKISKVAKPASWPAAAHSNCIPETSEQTTQTLKRHKGDQANLRNMAAKSFIPSSQCVPARHVIAMAASVGGLKALSLVLGDLPADFPAAIVIVMHVSPDHESLLAELLNWRTRLVVKEAKTGDMLCDSSVFVAPPNHHLFVVKGGSLELSSTTSEKVHYARPSAEPLFASVADIYKENAIAVVLTGGDGDGSIGVQIIKEKGGTVIAQDRATSKDFSMPETSIKTGDVDFILPVNEIALKLIELVAQAKILECQNNRFKEVED